MTDTISHTEAAALLGVSVNTIRNRIIAGHIPYAERNERRGGRVRWILDRATIEAIARGYEVRRA